MGFILRKGGFILRSVDKSYVLYFNYSKFLSTGQYLSIGCQHVINIFDPRSVKYTLYTHKNSVCGRA